ncbi:thermonuclease family protein [Lentibacillus sp. N15]|uniref:thermonuclease family protein n=1 Tax=Lentibacillus songyuanensis TaxID=3136161 RepID=UPI0031B9FC7C
MVIFLLLGFNDFGLIHDFVDRVKNEGSIHDSSFDKNTLKKGEAIISRVIDGDTVMVINPDGKEERVRLLLIDTPESVHPTEPEQKFGKEASDFAKKYLKQGLKVTLERGNPEKDKYDRTLGYIFVDGVNFNELMLEKGYARIAYVYEPSTKYLYAFKKAQKRAKQQRMNIWSIPGYVTESGFDMSVVE